MDFKTFFKMNFYNKTMNISLEIGEIKIIYIYRYSSWFLTSLFYLIRGPHSPFLFKLGVVLSLYIAARVITDLYIKFKTHNSTIKTLVLIETLGITLLLFPTGGLESPFIWYALNPVLIAASFLPIYFCWVTLFFYTTFATLETFILFNKSQQKLIGVIYNNSYLLLVFILVTLAMQLLSWLSQQLSKQSAMLKSQSKSLLEMNNKLQDINGRLTESIDHIMSLYQASESFIAQDDPINLPNIFVNYASKLTKSNLSFFWIAPIENNNSQIIFKGEIIREDKDNLISSIEIMWESLKSKDKATKINIINRNFMVVVVRSSLKYFGLLGIEIQCSLGYEVETQNIKQLTFLSELSSLVLERFHLQEVSKHFIIVKEQNRIANEMHDSITQHLFSIACSIYAINSKWEVMSKEELKEQLEAIRECANVSMKELRSCIYELSSKKRGEKTLFISIRNYCDSISTLNGIQIDLNLRGDEELLSFLLKRAIYRIICEASGNSIRHGKCSEIKISIVTQPNYTYIIVKDNGKGINLDNIDNENKRGLGIDNIKSLVKNFKGEFVINSKNNHGTEINIIIPNNI